MKPYQMDPYSYSEAVAYMSLLGWSNKNIAWELKLTQNTVKQMLWRRRRLTSCYLSPTSPFLVEALGKDRAADQ